MNVRKEEFYDHVGVRLLNEKAFGRDDEGRLVDELRSAGKAALALVAEEDDTLVGYAMFTHVRPEHGSLKIAGLGPVAILPEYQGRGIGTELIHQGLKLCKQAGFQAVATLGEPSFYSRFGFVPAALHGFSCVFEAAEDAFLILPFSGTDLSGSSGKLYYEPEFDAFA